MFLRASSSVSPSLMHPGNEGTYTVYPPSSEGSSTTRIFIIYSLLQPHRDAHLRQVSLSVPDRVGAVVEDAGCENGISLAQCNGIVEMCQVAGASRGDDRHGDGI